MMEQSFGEYQAGSHYSPLSVSASRFLFEKFLDARVLEQENTLVLIESRIDSLPKHKSQGFR